MPRVARSTNFRTSRGSKPCAAIASVVVSAVLMAIKFVAYYYTTSAVIFSDALESIVNVIASIVAGIFAFSRTSAGGR